MILILTISSIAFPVIADNEIKVQLNGVELNFDVQPQLIDNRTMVPMRKIFEALGATVVWYEETQEVIATRGDTVIELKIGSPTLIKNKQTVLLDVAPRVIDDRTLVPVRAVAESFNAVVKWDENAKTVLISKDDTQSVTPSISSEPYPSSIDTSDPDLQNYGVVVNVNQKPVSVSKPIYLYRSQIFMGARALCDILGLESNFDSDNMQITLTKGNNVLIMKNGSNKCSWNGKEYGLDAPPILFGSGIGAAIYLPAKNVVEYFNGKLTADTVKKTVSIILIDDKPNLANNSIKDIIAKLGIQIIQNDKIFNLTDKINEVRIKKDSFSIRFNSNRETDQNYYAYCINVSDSESNFNSTCEGEKTGNKALEDGVFAGGKGMAEEPNKSIDELIICNSGFHNIYYRDADNYRATLIKDNNGLLTLECNIKQVYNYDTNEAYSLGNSIYNELYILFYYDSNLNSVIDEGELVKLKLLFE